MKKILLLSVFAALIFMSCEEETDTLKIIGDFDYRTEYTNAHILDTQETGTGYHWIEIDNDGFTVVMDISGGSYADYECSIDIEYYDANAGIVIGTLSNDVDGITGTFRYEHQVSFEFKANNTTGEPTNFYLYN